MTAHIPEALCQEVIARAGGVCEYCGLPQAASPYTHHIDHILADVHGWPTTLENLALACAVCNERKGPTSRRAIQRLISLRSSICPVVISGRSTSG